MIKRRHLRHFVAVAECGGITAAARKLNLSQPTLSASLAELEKIVGASLIVRDGRRMRVTDGGFRLLSLARSIENDFRLAETVLVSDPVPHAPLRLGMLTSLPSQWLVDIRRNYFGVRPLVIIEGDDANLRRRLNAGQLEAAITLVRARDEPEGEIVEEDYAVLLSASHELARHKLLVPEALVGEVMVARRSCEILGPTSDFFTARGVRPHFLMRSSNEERCLDLVRNGFAVTTGPVSLATREIVARALEGYDFQRKIGLLFRDNQREHELSAAWDQVALST